MTANTRRFATSQAALLVLVLLMALIPSSTAFADLTADSTEAAVEETSTEAAVADPAEDPAPEEEPAPPAEDLGEIAESGAPETEAPLQAAEEEGPTAGPTAKGGANTSGPYDPSGVGEPSGNGNGDGGNKPCAGCVGNADDKNPPGQLPGPDEDGDNGYECDGNSGVGKTNPAHSGCAVDEPDPDPSIGLVKTGPRTTKVGRTITYQFSVKNTGDTALSNVHITDPLIGGGAIAVSPSTLPVGGTGQASAQYTVRAEDVNASNEVPNTATVTGTDPDGDVVTAQDSWVMKVPPVIIVVPKRHTICHATGKPTKFVVITPSVRGVYNGHLGFSHHQARDIIPPFAYDANGNGVIDANETFSQNWDAAGQAIFNAGCQVPTPPAPEIELIKDGPDEAEIGDTITYTFDVTNTGDTVLTNVHVTDPLLGGAPIAVTPSTLAADGGTGTATAQYTVAEADVVDETVPNTATAHGTPPTGPAVLDTDDHIVSVPDITETPEPEIDLIKDGPDEARIGDTITYTFEVTNTGETALTNVHVTDPLLGGTPIAVTPSTLAADGGTGTATAQYTVAEADIVDETVPNTATAHGTPPAGPEVTATDDHIVEVPKVIDCCNPGIELEKNGPATARAGDQITYTFTVTNTGDVALTNVHVQDPLISSRMLPVTPSTLAPDAVGTASATYTVTEDDAEAGEILNTAVGRGTPPTGPDVEDRDKHVVEVPDIPVGPRPGIRLEKTGPATARVGDVITYRFRASNTGRTTLTNVHITDARLGIDNLAVTPSTLLPGESGTASATYTVTQRDAAAGVIHNTAIVTGTPPTGDPITDRDDHTTEVPGLPPGPTPPDNPDLPATGTDAPTQLLLAALALLMGAALLMAARRTTPHFEAWTTGTMPGRGLSGSDTPPPVHRRLGGGARPAT